MIQPKQIITFFVVVVLSSKNVPPSVTACLLTVMCNPRCVPYVTYRTTMLYHVYLQHSCYHIVLLIYTALLSTHIEIQANMTIRVQGFFYKFCIKLCSKSSFWHSLRSKLKGWSWPSVKLDCIASSSFLTKWLEMGAFVSCEHPLTISCWSGQGRPWYCSCPLDLLLLDNKLRIFNHLKHTCTFWHFLFFLHH